jgi:hypothetical protein
MSRCSTITAKVIQREIALVPHQVSSQAMLHSHDALCSVSSYHLLVEQIDAGAAGTRFGINGTAGEHHDLPLVKEGDIITFAWSGSSYGRFAQLRVHFEKRTPPASS